MNSNEDIDSIVKTEYAISPDKQESEPPKKIAKKKFDISDHGGILFIVIIAGVLLLLGLERLIHSGVGGRLRSSYSTAVEEKKALKEEYGDEGRKSELDIAKTLAQADESIKKEIDKIRNEKGLPEQIFQRDIPPSENVGALITKEFSSFDPVSYENIRDCITRHGPWAVDWTALRTQSSVLERFVPQRDRLRELLDSPNAKFEQDLIGTSNLGLVPDEQNIDSSWSYLTVEECEIARCLYERDLDGAVESLRYMLRFTELAAQTRFAVMRIHAVYMRENALRILQTIVLDEKFTPIHANTLIRILRQTLKDWPPDAQCWIGERADGLRRFNQIRMGDISGAFNEEEQEELQGLDVLGVKQEKDPKKRKGTTMLGKISFYKPRDSNLDQDYYLKAMRVIIDSCSLPYYLRLKALNRITDHLQSLQGKKNYPAISMLLLRGIREQMQKQALDKARIEAWYLALAVSLKHAVKEGAVDPVRGKPYTIARTKTPEGDRIVVVYGNGDQKVEVKE